MLSRRKKTADLREFLATYGVAEADLRREY